MLGQDVDAHSALKIDAKDKVYYQLTTLLNFHDVSRQRQSMNIEKPPLKAKINTNRAGRLGKI